MIEAFRQLAAYPYPRHYPVTPSQRLISPPDARPGPGQRRDLRHCSSVSSKRRIRSTWDRRSGCEPFAETP